MNAIFAFLHKVLHPLTKLGGGKSWMIGNVRVELWPFVAMAIFVLLLVIYDLAVA